MAAASIDGFLPAEHDGWMDWLRTDRRGVELLRGMFLYHIVDEVVLYLLPVTGQGGVRVLEGFTASRWKTVQIRRYGNGICRIVYRKVSH